MNFKASPGIAIIKEITEKDDSSLTLTQKSAGRIIYGEIVSMGKDTTGNAGEPIKAEDYGKMGDKVWFLHYFDEGGVDIGEIDGQKFLFVKFGDFRASRI